MLQKIMLCAPSFTTTLHIGGQDVEADLSFNPQGDSCGSCHSLNTGAEGAAAARGEPGIKGEPGLPGIGEQGLPVSAKHIPR